MKKLITILLFPFAFSILPSLCNAQYSVLYDFNWGGGAGSSPRGDLTHIPGLLYGMAQIGGVHGYGTIFSIDTAGNRYKDLYNFNGPYGVIGSLTISGKTMYGMTSEGGGGIGTYCPSGCGCVFQVDTNGTGFKQILTFNGTNGGYAWGNLTKLGGRLFGLSLAGGANNAGCAFAIDTGGGGYKDILDFNQTNGAAPEGSFILLHNQLFGMATAGGGHDSGCIFRLDTNGGGYKDLHDFRTLSGTFPGGSLLYASGKFYGMTFDGGTHDSGVVFCIDTNGNNYKKLHDLSSAEGAYPRGSLVISGNVLYGMTNQGGAHDSGAMFSVDTNGGNFTKLFDFTGTEGVNPFGSLTVVGNDLFGMTTAGGTLNSGGVIFTYKNISTGRDQLPVGSGQVLVYPNPSSGIFTIHFAGAQNFETVKIEIYNVLGEQVYSTNYPLTTNHYSLDLSSNPSGIYLYRVIANKGNILGEGKLVIEK
jgi:uncharacterized repeat protein (TIGR03803 family)